MGQWYVMKNFANIQRNVGKKANVMFLEKFLKKVRKKCLTLYFRKYIIKIVKEDTKP